MGYARYPRAELAVFGVASLSDCRDSLDKGILKDVIGNVFVFDKRHDIGKDSVLMTRQ